MKLNKDDIALIMEHTFTLGKFHTNPILDVPKDKDSLAFKAYMAYSQSLEILSTLYYERLQNPEYQAKVLMALAWINPYSSRQQYVPEALREITLAREIKNGIGANLGRAIDRLESFLQSQANSTTLENVKKDIPLLVEALELKQQR